MVCPSLSPFHGLPTMKNQLKLLAVGIGSGLAIGAVAPVSANTAGSTTASVPALSAGMVAPTISVGTDEVKKGTVQYSNSVGSNDAFSVGAMTNVGSSVSASSTPDYDVTSKAVFGIGSSTINQQIGTATAKSNSTNNTISDITETANTITNTEVSKDFTQDTSSRGGWWWWNRRNNTRTHITNEEKSTVETQYKKDVLADVTETLKSSSSMSGTISGSFNKTFSSSGNTNDVTVNGIGTDAKVVSASASSFDADVKKGSGSNTGAGTASGSAAGNVGTTATANANSSQFVSSFAQAY
jgi:hypothetical protein